METSRGRILQISEPCCLKLTWFLMKWRPATAAAARPSMTIPATNSV